MSECVVISEGDNGNGVRFHRGTEFKISMCLSEPDLHKAASLDDMTERLDDMTAYLSKSMALNRLSRRFSACHWESHPSDQGGEGRHMEI